MRILILTQPLIENYGGILQNYALQTVLKKRGHSVETLNTEAPLAFFKRYGLRFLSMGKQLLLLILGKNRSGLIRQWMTCKERKICYNKISQFIEMHISMTSLAGCLGAMRKYRGYDAYVVGSDQVWRKSYSPCLPVYFLNFLPENNSAKKISYAASFGSAKLDFAPKEIEKYSRLLQRFDAVSVREFSGQKLCCTVFNISAEVVPDPTMLLTAEDYYSLRGEHLNCAKGKLVTYILDETPEKTNIIKNFADEHDLEIIRLWGSFSLSDLRSSTPPEKQGIDYWLAAIESAEYVITDSFHGTVFSLIFQKEFFVFVNHARGKERFDMLDELFEISDRFIDISSCEMRIPKPLNCGEIEEVLDRCRNSGMCFLKQNGF